MAEKEIKKCCICGIYFIGYGNNPAPLKKYGRCCDDCNKKVIAARIREIQKRHNKPQNKPAVVGNLPLPTKSK